MVCEREVKKKEIQRGEITECSYNYFGMCLSVLSCLCRKLVYVMLNVKLCTYLSVVASLRYKEHLLESIQRQKYIF